MSDFATFSDFLREFQRGLENGLVRLTLSSKGVPSDVIAQIEGGAPKILNDPSLNVEDKVTILLMLIMKKLDRDIDSQKLKVKAMQSQSDSQQGSVDVETKMLMRMITKRSQMFDMLRQIVDKYNDTAKNTIQNMR